MFIIILIVLIPLTIVSTLIFREAQIILNNEEMIKNTINTISNLFPLTNINESTKYTTTQV